jgi:dipeptidyl aminopeptidase/acylaminoacyl peptidase
VPRRLVALALGILAASPAALARAAGRPLTINDLMAMRRVSDPQVSPDGTRVVYTVAVANVTANRVEQSVWMASIQNGVARALTTSGQAFGARWAPDGRQIAFVSVEGERAQLNLLEIDGGRDARMLASPAGGVDSLVWSPDGQLIAFTSEVYADCRDEDCNLKRDDERRRSPVRARLYDQLLYRHWSAWSEGKRRHLFVVQTSGGVPRDLTVGADYDVPPREREGPHPIAFSPDSRTLCFTAITDRVEATSTNADLFEVTIAGGSPKQLTTNPGFDGAPAYSPDGKTLAYRSQARAGYESDKWRLMLLDRSTGRSVSLTDAFDRSVESPMWSPDGASLYFNAEDRGEMPLFVIGASGGAPRPVTGRMYVGEFDVRGGRIVVASSSFDSPVELHLIDNGTARRLTRHNQELLATLDLAKPESFTFTGSGGASVEGFLVRPPAFDASRKYPVVMLLHGGPQTQWSDAWSYRWNAQLFAAAGWVVVMINRRGSTGFGQQFTDDITLDWGGKPFDDLMKGLDYVLGAYRFTDAARVAAAGASYGGYMVDWLASHARGRFRALVSHAGVYNLTSMYGSTEELWFPEHDLGGLPWTAAGNFERLSPHEYAADFARYKTPTLVTCGELDFRVPYTQSLEFFTALQRQGVPSRLIVFPDEGHWILKPQNSRFWYSEVIGWLEKYLNAP